MNKTRKAAVGLAVAAVLAAGGAAVAVPALAGNGPGFGDGPGAGETERPAMAGDLADRPGHGQRDGTCLVTPDTPAGDLTSQQESTLAAIADQQKLAHDLYAAFADQYDEAVFDRAATAESRQLTAVRTWLDRYEVDDPTAGLAAGQFAGAEVQDTYDQLLSDGSADLAAALEVARTLEQAEADALEDALDGVSGLDLTRLYEHLLDASQRHLTRIQSWPTS